MSARGWPRLAVGWVLIAAVAFGANAMEKFAEGNRQYKAGHYKEALAAFEEAHRLKPSPSLLKRIADCREKTGDLAGAIDALRGFLADPKATEKDTVSPELSRLIQKKADETVAALEAQKKALDEQQEALERAKKEAADAAAARNAAEESARRDREAAAQATKKAESDRAAAEKTRVDAELATRTEQERTAKARADAEKARAEAPPPPLVPPPRPAVEQSLAPAPAATAPPTTTSTVATGHPGAVVLGILAGMALAAGTTLIIAEATQHNGGNNGGGNNCGGSGCGSCGSSGCGGGSSNNDGGSHDPAPIGAGFGLIGAGITMATTAIYIAW